MLARRQELNTELQVLIDAFLPALSLSAAMPCVITAQSGLTWARASIRKVITPGYSFRTIPAVIMGQGAK